jgi:pimeloyl-ACP methyl ester carboxylesterase
MQYFSALGYPCYALSVRGHGHSWKPGYMRMVWGYGKYDFAQDMAAAIGFVSGVESGIRFKDGAMFEAEDLVLLGHSAGGGLVQYFLGQGMGKAGGLVVIAGFPCFGG